jgi:L-asparaginase
MSLSNIYILATGGTIAGQGGSTTAPSYQAGAIGVQNLIDAVPEMKQLANVTGEQVVNIGSYDMNDAIWLKLAKRANELLASDDVDGIVVTHGTDTLEETAYFLDLVVKSDKPVVVVGAMRPASAMSADGPFNLYNAVLVASDANSKGRGVLVVLNDVVWDARDVTKTITTQVETFRSVNFGALGLIHSGHVDYQRRVERLHTYQTEFDISALNALPKVDILFSYANASAAPARALIEEGAQGIVTAGVGNGTMYRDIFEALKEARKRGIVVVRSSRVGSGTVPQESGVNYSDFGFFASGTLNPQKSRVLLQLALTRTQDVEAIKKMFDKY